MELSIEEFIALETRMAKVLERRVSAGLEGIYDTLRVLVLAGAAKEVEDTILRMELPRLNNADQRTLQLLAHSMVRLGAGSVTRKQAARWLKPTDQMTDLLDLSLQQMMQIERIYVVPTVARVMSGVVRAEVEALEKDVQKDDKDLVPRDFGYTPKLAAPTWKQAVGAAVEATGPATTFAANLTTSRLVNYGALDAMHAEGITEYRLKAKMDKNTSQICRRLNGKKFRVKESLELLQRALTVTNPNQLKAIHPWVPGDVQTLRWLTKAKVEELRAKGYMVPPFHPHCRTIVVRGRSRITSPPPPLSILQPQAAAQSAAPKTKPQGALSFLEPAKPKVLEPAGAAPKARFVVPTKVDNAEQWYQGVRATWGDEQGFSDLLLALRTRPVPKSVVRDLLAALRRREVDLPVDASKDDLIEALIRWRHDQLLLEPANFEFTLGAVRGKGTTPKTYITMPPKEFRLPGL